MAELLGWKIYFMNTNPWDSNLIICDHIPYPWTISEEPCLLQTIPLSNTKPNQRGQNILLFLWSHSFPQLHHSIGFLFSSVSSKAPQVQVIPDASRICTESFLSWKHYPKHSWQQCLEIIHAGDPNKAGDMSEEGIYVSLPLLLL